MAGNMTRTHGRAVVTGMGIVGPTGIGLDPFWDSLVHARSGIAPLTLFDVSQYPVKFGGEVKHFNLREHVPDVKPYRLARQTQLALVACKQAIEHAGLSAAGLRRLGLVSMVLGISSGGADIVEQAKEIIMTRGADKVRPYMVGACQPHAIGAALVQHLGIQATVTTVSEACPAGLDAVAVGARLIREGRADLVIVGGADSPLSNTGLAGFAAAGLPTRSDEFPPAAACRPFDARRSGVVLSEGAGFVVLERLENALARGATLYLEVLGGGMASDQPGAEKMDGLYQAMELALANAGMRPDRIDYVCANAFGSPVADAVEVAFLKRCLGPRAYRVPVSSIRGVLGHALSAGAMAQVIACALMIRHQTVAPTANLEYPDPACDLDHVPLRARPARIGVALANAHGIGGENASLLVGSPP